MVTRVVRRGRWHPRGVARDRAPESRARGKGREAKEEARERRRRRQRLAPRRLSSPARKLDRCDIAKPDSTEPVIAPLCVHAHARVTPRSSPVDVAATESRWCPLPPPDIPCDRVGWKLTRARARAYWRLLCNFVIHGRGGDALFPREFPRVPCVNARDPVIEAERRRPDGIIGFRLELE